MADTKSWKDFGGQYLKAQNVESSSDQYVVVAVGSENRNEREVVILTLERECRKKLFGCNVGNEATVQQQCPVGPNQAIGRIVTFDKVKTQKPGTSEIVDGLRIKFVPEDEHTGEKEEVEGAI